MLTADIVSYDQRGRLIAAAAAAFVFSAMQSWTVLAAGALCAILLAALARYPLALLLRHLAPANFFLLFLLLTVPWSMPGHAAFSIGPLDFSREGLSLAGSAAVKCNIILVVFLVLMRGMEIAGMGAALERLKAPPKMVFLLLFTFRHIHVIGSEWKRMQAAAALRGFHARTSLHTYRTIASMLGMTVVSSIERSRRAYEAMLLRGFCGSFHTAEEPCGGGKAFFCCFAAVLALLAAAEHMAR